MSGRRILVIDDEPDIRRMLETTLTGHGYVVETAADGLEGVRKGALFLPDLVLLDIMMPDMDGFTVYQRSPRAARSTTSCTGSSRVLSTTSPSPST